MNECLRTLIIDDEPESVRILQEELAGYPDVLLVGCATTATEGRKMVEELSPDLLFVDIEMPDASGFDLLDDLSNNPLVKIENLHIVIYTAYYKHHANEAYRRNETDYLLKPFRHEELDLIIRRSRQHSFPVFRTRNLSEQGVTITTNTNDLLLLRSRCVGYFRYNTKRSLWEVLMKDGNCIALRRGVKAETILSCNTQFVQTHQA